jgi:nucleoside-diphosphate-sugar epimerase
MWRTRVDSELKMIITRAKGFIGVHTIRSLSKEGYRVEAVDIKTDALEEFYNNKLCEIQAWVS